MNEPQNGSLSLEDVIRRFADSEQALSQAREKLEALATIEDTQEAATQSLQDASASTKELVAAVRELVLEADETQKVARSVLEAGAALIDGTDLRELQDGVDAITKTVEDGFGRIEQLLGEVRERDEKITELQTELERRTGVLSGRQRKRLGLE